MIGAVWPRLKPFFWANRGHLALLAPEQPDASQLKRSVFRRSLEFPRHKTARHTAVPDECYAPVMSGHAIIVE